MEIVMAGAVAAAGGAAQPPAGAASPALAKLCADFWEGHLAANPVEATSLGDRRYDDRLSDNSPAGLARDKARLSSVLERARAIAEVGLAGADRITLSELVTEVEGQLARLECATHEWTVDPLGGPHVEFFNVESFQPVTTQAQGRALVSRWRAMGPYVDAHVSNLKTGLAAGKVGTREAVEKVIAGLDETLARPDSEWALLRPAAAPHPGWTAAELAEFREGVARAASEGLRPALLRYRAFLKAEVLPRARPQEKSGVMHVPGGPACYRGMIRVHTSLDLAPDELHATGLSEVARINAELERLGEKVLGLSDRTAILARLRTDKSLYFATRDEVQAKAREALDKAARAIPSWFGILPKAPCEVVRMEPHEEKHSTIAYYRQPAADGSRPGRYYINTYAPDTRPRYEAEALAFHEAIPGHHLQIAIAQELKDLPEFRKHMGVTAYVEGWALYTERLSDEMGLYAGDLDRIGMLSFEAWRACRLVVDTGMHAKGWSRKQAIEFMRENTALAENNIANEVDRYIVWPGQALAYKTGQLEILRLREQARAALGERFDIRRFHDAVLSNGAVALSTLRRRVESFGKGL